MVAFRARKRHRANDPRARTHLSEASSDEITLPRRHFPQERSRMFPCERTVEAARCRISIVTATRANNSAMLTRFYDDVTHDTSSKSKRITCPFNENARIDRDFRHEHVRVARSVFQTVETICCSAYRRKSRLWNNTAIPGTARVRRTWSRERSRPCRRFTAKQIATTVDLTQVRSYHELGEVMRRCNYS